MKNKDPRKTRKAPKRKTKVVVSWHEAVVLDHHMLSCMPNVERVELGWKERDGKITGRMAVKIYVSEKKADIAEEERIPKTARVLVPAGKGIYKMRRIPTDVVWHAPAEFLAAPMPS